MFLPLSKVLFLLSMVFAVCPALGADEVNFNDFDIYQGTVSYAKAKERLKLLEKSSEIAAHYDLTEDALTLYSSADEKRQGKTEYVLRLGSNARPASLTSKTIGTSNRPLAQLRVALDPGHIGGEAARLEGRYVDMKLTPELGAMPLQFDEGTLSVATAHYLRRLLEEAGATVMMTRTKPGQYVSEVTYPEWRRSKAFTDAIEVKVSAIADEKKRDEARQWWLKEAPEATIFRTLYNNEDLRARVALINAFKPDVTFDIHYNAAAGNDPSGKNLGSQENYNMVFAPGSFMKGELTDKLARYQFLRLIASDDLDRSITMSGALIQEFEKGLKVRTVKSDEPSAAYLRTACVAAGIDGVYCRNLGITRLAQSPIAYGESLCQDNFEECKRLADKSFEIEGIRTSARVKEVAEAYYRATIAVYAKR